MREQYPPTGQKQESAEGSSYPRMVLIFTIMFKCEGSHPNAKFIHTSAINVELRQQ